MNDETCCVCNTRLYRYPDGSGGDEYMCPKCEYECLPKHMMERFPEWRKKEFICEHFNWKDHCKACDTWNPAYNPKGYTGWNDPKRIGVKGI